ncbi:MAG TPA: DinB family protein [Blastocatellia bacterium]|nr:DinB family protein [Blastocatellia bacterium]
MDKNTLSDRFDYLTMAHGVTLRAIGSFSDGELDFRPVPQMRSARELIHHIYAGERGLAQGVRQGRIEADDPKAAELEMAAMTTVAAAQEFARSCHQAALDALGEMSDAEVARIVESPYGSFPAWQFFLFAYDEHWHHRGQLYTYLRLLGKEPPFLYDYEGN